jgi:diguanylate cyclase (GGDEF)-like protein
VRETDTVARIGGDEFALILANAGQDEAGAVLEKVVATNAAPVDFEDRALAVSVSVGACAYPECAREETALRKQADLRMYQAKRAGGNRYVL